MRSVFVLQIRRPNYWRIELQPQPVPNEQTNPQALEDVLDTILLFEKTHCPFKRSFTVDIPDEGFFRQVGGKIWKPRSRQMSETPETEMRSDADGFDYSHPIDAGSFAAVNLDDHSSECVCCVAQRVGTETWADGTAAMTESRDICAPDDVLLRPEDMRPEAQRPSKGLQTCDDNSLSPESCSASQAEEASLCVQLPPTLGLDGSVYVTSGEDAISFMKSVSYDSTLASDSGRDRTSQPTSNGLAKTEGLRDPSAHHFHLTMASSDTFNSVRPFSCEHISRSSSYDSFQSIDSYTAVGQENAPITTLSMPISSSANRMAAQDNGSIKGSPTTDDFAFLRRRGHHTISLKYSDTKSEELDSIQTKSTHRIHFRPCHVAYSLVRLILACFSFLVTFTARVVAVTYYGIRHIRCLAVGQHSQDLSHSPRHSTTEFRETGTDKHCYAATESTASGPSHHEVNASSDR
jgi:hypothetical protein